MQILIARLAQLKVLNGSAVRPREREDAEKAYLRNSRSAVLAGHGLDANVADAVAFGM